MDGGSEKAAPSPGLFDGGDRQLPDTSLYTGKEREVGYAVPGCGLQLGRPLRMLPKKRRVTGLPIEKSLAPSSRRRRRSRAATKKAFHRHEGLLHEKIQLYIYKPSINREQT